MPNENEDLRNVATEDQKRLLRKVKQLPVVVKAILYEGSKDMQAITQFHQDLRIFGLWEALLYVQGYEDKPYRFYTTGTARKAFDEAIASLQ